MTSLFNALIDEKRVPTEWRKAMIVPLFKNKGSMMDCGNFRCISFTPVPSKLFMRVLLNKIKSQTEQKLGKNKPVTRKEERRLT